MGSLENFLLARIAEDELAADVLAEPMRDRVLTVLEAIRRAVAMRVNALRDHSSFVMVSDYDHALWDVLTVLALPYAEHPDYRAAFQPTGNADVEPEPNRPPLQRAVPGTVALSEAQDRAYLDVAIALAQAVLIDDPATAEQWTSTSIGVIGTAWSNEMDTVVILSRALLAMTRLSIAQATLTARHKAGATPSERQVSAALAAMAERET
jgi:Family of unknown function (DUF6221)